jgi:hypothetical protein
LREEGRERRKEKGRLYDVRERQRNGKGNLLGDGCRVGDIR